ncbi:hypothetical protein ACIPLC_15135 [Kitasatospora sp. NPDC086801]|uniref:hypothetical protein n=1 Tax=Kitasatospora sp. NPDC086801 TaxID=3364066 RepID=UPI0037F452D6
MYSYDVSASPGRSTTVPRSIPGMRPSYDAEHPHSTTPIYDELYSEYRRLFRALPGDRSGEEDLKFTGFAVRDGYPMLGEPRPYPPQHQAFHTYGGQAPGLPQFMPSQQHGHSAGHATGHTGHTSHTGHGAAGHTHHGAMGHTGHSAPQQHSHPEPAAPTSDGFGQAAPAATTPQHAPQHSPQHNPPPAHQFTNGQGWVAAGYLGPIPHSMPAPPPAPAPVMGTATGVATAAPASGRHRQMLSLPPGRNGDHH